MRRCLRPLIALIAAYAILFAALFGAITSVRAAAFGPSVYCDVSGAGTPTPIAPAHQGPDCCIGCFANSAALPTPEPSLGVRLKAPDQIFWEPRVKDLVRSAPSFAPPARAPPLG